MTKISELTSDSIALLKSMISTPSLSREEEHTAALIRQFFHTHEIPTEQVGNNIIAYNQFHSADKPYILLNSHHDTVKANPGYTKDPCQPLEIGRASCRERE